MAGVKSISTSFEGATKSLRKIIVNWTVYDLNELEILKLTGKIKERWYTDYYGGFDQTLIFDPYKATQGNLEIRFELN